MNRCQHCTTALGEDDGACIATLRPFGCHAENFHVKFLLSHILRAEEVQGGMVAHWNAVGNYISIILQLY